MDSMDNGRERFAALGQQKEGRDAPTRMVERRLCWWRSFACGAALLSLMSFAHPGHAVAPHCLGVMKRGDNAPSPCGNEQKRTLRLR